MARNKRVRNKVGKRVFLTPTHQHTSFYKKEWKRIVRFTASEFIRILSKR